MLVLHFLNSCLYFSSESEQSEEEGELIEEDESDLESEMAFKKSNRNYAALRSVNPIVQVTQINPEEIPDVPKNRFLYRGVVENRGEPKGEREVVRGVERGREVERRRPRDGGRKKVKGRGAVVSNQSISVVTNQSIK